MYTIDKLDMRNVGATSYMEVQIVLVWRALPVFRLTHFSTDPHSYSTYSKVYQIFLDRYKVLVKIIQTSQDSFYQLNWFTWFGLRVLIGSKKVKIKVFEIY